MSDKKSNKLAAGSIVVLLGSIVLRLGGFIYRFILSRLLSTTGYGIVGLTLPFQNILTIGASGGVPPTIAKYVSQYEAVDNDKMAYQIIISGMKLMVVMGILAAVIMFMCAEPIATAWHKPQALIPLQLVAIIAPFSVLVGAMRGVFQGFYQMKNILFSRMVEQVFTIIVAIILVLLGWYAAGAVMGTCIGFMMALIYAYYIYKKEVKDVYFTGKYNKISSKQELSIIIQIFKFSIPVVITGLAEVLLYDIGTIFIGLFLVSSFAAFYTNASAMARLPLMLSNSVSTSVLPAASEANSLNDRELLELYIHQSYRYTTMTTLPFSLFIMAFAGPILGLLFGSQYTAGSGALFILTSGMFFFSLYSICSSMCQGLGKPTVPMISLIIGTIVDAVLSYFIIPIFSIEGAAIATTIAAFIIMCLTIYQLTRISGVNPPAMDIVRITGASLLMYIVMILFWLLHNGLLAMVLGGIIGGMSYPLFLLLFKGVKREDVGFVKGIIRRTGPFKSILTKIGVKLYKYTR